MALGVIFGVVLALSLAVGINVAGVPLLAAIGLGKLSFLVAAGVLGVGAALRRLGIRNEHRKALALARPDDARLS